MSRAFRRKIKVLNEDYFWVLDGNSIDSNKDYHIRIHSIKSTKSSLYLDPYNWHFEIRPMIIEQAILFALENGWHPEQKDKIMYLSMKNEGQLYQLPEGVKFGYLDTNKLT